MNILGLIIVIAVRCVWGFATQAIVDNKGYYENWFWWGFFFGLIALLVAVSKPQIQEEIYINSKSKDEDILSHGGWKCSCGRVNAAYTGTCGCGRTKSESNKPEEKFTTPTDELKKLKNLLDEDIITQEDYDLKKKQLLGL